MQKKGYAQDFIAIFGIVYAHFNNKLPNISMIKNYDKILVYSKNKVC